MSKMKFKYVSDDKARIEGEMSCTDKQWTAIWNILLAKPSATNGGTNDRPEGSYAQQGDR